MQAFSLPDPEGSLFLEEKKKLYLLGFFFPKWLQVIIFSDTAHTLVVKIYTYGSCFEQLSVCVFVCVCKI